MQFFKRSSQYLETIAQRIDNKGEGNIGSLFIVVCLVVAASGAFMFIGGQLPSPKANPNGQQVIVITPTPETAKNNLQLLTFYGVTPVPQLQGHACQQSQGTLVNTESEILIGTDPAPNGTALAGGKIRVWVQDENPLWISPNEVVDTGAGTITTPGNRTAVDTGTDGEGKFLWEPSLYVVPTTTKLNADNVYCEATTAGCVPHFPNIIKGSFDTADHFANGNGRSGSESITGAPLDDYTQFQNGPDPRGGNPNGNRTDDFKSEYIWDINSLALPAGDYTAQFVVHDGDDNLAIDCITIKI
jgi:hypothetical protein